MGELPYPGCGPWRCPVCNRPTVKVYRCTNGDCGVNLAGREVEMIDRPDMDQIVTEHDVGTDEPADGELQ